MAFEPDYRTYEDGFDNGAAYVEKELQSKIKKLEAEIESLKSERDRLKETVKALKKALT